MTRQALGKGLSALLKDREETTEPELRELDLDLLEPNPFQPRQVFADAKLEELSQSIRTHGFVQPLIVRKHGNRYQIVAGERRWRAAQRLGLLRVPALVREVSNEKLLEVSLIENIQRENLNPIEEARAYHRLAHEFGLTQEEVAQRTGKERSRGYPFHGACACITRLGVSYPAAGDRRKSQYPRVVRPAIRKKHRRGQENQAQNKCPYRTRSQCPSGS
jgi:ParB/RepB/Spo0J family partition protein